MGRVWRPENKVLIPTYEYVEGQRKVKRRTKYQKAATMNFSRAAATPNKPFWELTVPEISQWIYALTPGIPNTGGMLFPAAANKPGLLGSGNPINNNTPNNPQDFETKKALGELLVRNLMTALSSASSFGNSAVSGGNYTTASSSPEAKRQKIDDHSDTKFNNGDGDMYKVLDPSFGKSNNNNNNNNTANSTTELSPGAILSRITLGGLVNGMSGVNGGCVDTLSCIPLSDLENDTNGHHRADYNEKAVATTTKGIDAVVDTAGNLILKDLIRLARGLLRSISAR